MKLNTNKGKVELQNDQPYILCDIGMHRLDLSKDEPTCIECGCKVENF